MAIEIPLLSTIKKESPSFDGLKYAAWRRPPGQPGESKACRLLHEDLDAAVLWLAHTVAGLHQQALLAAADHRDRLRRHALTHRRRQLALYRRHCRTTLLRASPRFPRFPPRRSSVARAEFAPGKPVSTPTDPRVRISRWTAAIAGSAITRRSSMPSPTASRSRKVPGKVRAPRLARARVPRLALRLAAPSELLTSG